ncbi:hypothetical protein BDZ89DRAFT_1044727 [Hymenopellis radicata]|nr:hypothetical protein BDZ89DRAFT_1044727 [Hymenopellis radicata]
MARWCRARFQVGGVKSPQMVLGGACFCLWEGRKTRGGGPDPGSDFWRRNREFSPDAALTLAWQEARRSLQFPKRQACFLFLPPSSYNLEFKNDTLRSRNLNHLTSGLAIHDLMGFRRRADVGLAGRFFFLRNFQRGYTASPTRKRTTPARGLFLNHGILLAYQHLFASPAWLLGPGNCAGNVHPGNLSAAWRPPRLAFALVLGSTFGTQERDILVASVLLAGTARALGEIFGLSARLVGISVAVGNGLAMRAAQCSNTVSLQKDRATLRIILTRNWKAIPVPTSLGTSQINFSFMKSTWILHRFEFGYGDGKLMLWTTEYGSSEQQRCGRVASYAQKWRHTLYIHPTTGAASRWAMLCSSLVSRTLVNAIIADIQ